MNKNPYQTMIDIVEAQIVTIKLSRSNYTDFEEVKMREELLEFLKVEKLEYDNIRTLNG